MLRVLISFFSGIVFGFKKTSRAGKKENDSNAWAWAWKTWLRRERHMISRYLVVHRFWGYRIYFRCFWGRSNINYIFLRDTINNTKRRPIKSNRSCRKLLERLLRWENQYLTYLKVNNCLYGYAWSWFLFAVRSAFCNALWVGFYEHV